MRTKARAIFILGFTLIAAVGLAVGSAQASPNLQTPPPTPVPNTLTGVVTLNSQAAPAGVRVSASLEDDTICGDTITDDDGKYILILAAGCPPDSLVRFVLVATGARATTEVEVKVEEGPQSADIGFQGLSAEDLLKVGAVPSKRPTKPNRRPRKRASAPLSHCSSREVSSPFSCSWSAVASFSSSAWSAQGLCWKSNASGAAHPQIAIQMRVRG